MKKGIIIICAAAVLLGLCVACGSAAGKDAADNAKDTKLSENTDTTKDLNNDHVEDSTDTTAFGGEVETAAEEVKEKAGKAYEETKDKIKDSADDIGEGVIDKTEELTDAADNMLPRTTE